MIFQKIDITIDKNTQRSTTVQLALLEVWLLGFFLQVNMSKNLEFKTDDSQYWLKIIMKCELTVFACDKCEVNCWWWEPLKSAKSAHSSTITGQSVVISNSAWA